MGVHLGLDPGQRRTGIALSDAVGILASPLRTHDRKTDRSLLDLIDELCTEHGVETVVVGHALTQGGDREESALRSERIAELLSERLKGRQIQVLLMDERYSTAEAIRLLAGKKRPREQRDAVAAALILQAYLDGQRGADS